MSCPHLKEVVMLFCDLCPVKKMLPLDRLASADPCLGRHTNCPIFLEALALAGQRAAAAAEATDPRARVATHKEVLS